MKRKMFGHREKRRSEDRRSPGTPVNFDNKGLESNSYGRAKDNPPKYEEDREHVKYRNPGFSRHDVDLPEDEPRMRSNVSKKEMHSVEDNYHMPVPDQTEDRLPRHIPRARMKMDSPDYNDPKPLLGNIVHNVPYKGEEDTTGEEEMGPRYMQEDDERMPKEERKRIIVATVKRKMKKQGEDDREDESLGERHGKKSQSYKDRRDEMRGMERYERDHDDDMDEDEDDERDHRQGYNDRLDESLGARHGRKSQSMAERRHESEGEEEHYGKRKYKGLRSSH